MTENEYKYICTAPAHFGRELGYKIGQMNIRSCFRKKCPFIGRVKRDILDKKL